MASEEKGMSARIWRGCRAASAWRRRPRVAAFRLAAIALLWASLAGHSFAGDTGPAAASALLVRTVAGEVRGSLSAGGAVLRWLGIPYARPPVGDLRWQPPQAPLPWDGVRAADAFGAPCAQIGSIYGPPPAGKPWGLANVDTFGKPVGSEDCLSLNIWRPSGATQPLPVIVFIHGGSNIAGAASDPLYDGAKLAASAGAVIVTINYRLGFFGWFTHPALATGDPLGDSGNYGTLDILQALRFVQANASAFGGDPANVTLMGQSAGAIDLYSVMASPLSDGLFHKAIVLSGLIASTTREKGAEFAERLAAALLVHDGLAATNQDAARYLAAQGPRWLEDYLRAKTGTELLDAVSRDPSLRRAPTCFGDGAVIPSDLSASFEQGRFRAVPTIVGRTRNEGKLFTVGAYKVSDAERFTMMLTSDPDAAPKVKLKDLVRPLLLPSWGSGLYDAYAWLILSAALHGVNDSISKLARHETKVFAYRFDWNRGPEPWKSVYGAGHAIDLPFVFGNFSNNFYSMDFSQANEPGRDALSQLMMRAIGAFIRSGDPNGAPLPTTWRPWRTDDRDGHYLLLDASDRDPIVSMR